jgi:hypothetical protein
MKFAIRLDGLTRRIGARQVQRIGEAARSAVVRRVAARGLEPAPSASAHAPTIDQPGEEI